MFSIRFKQVSPLEIHPVQRILGHFCSVDFCCFSDMYSVLMFGLFIVDF